MVGLVHDNKAALRFSRFSITIIYAPQEKIESIAYFFKRVLNRIAWRDVCLINGNAKESDRGFLTRDDVKCGLNHAFAIITFQRAPRIGTAAIHIRAVKFDIVRISAELEAFDDIIQRLDDVVQTTLKNSDTAENEMRLVRISDRP